MTSGAQTRAKSEAGGSHPWISLVLGAAVLAGVVVAATHFAEEEAFVRLVREAKPWWFVAALLLQAGTYLAQGAIWRLAGQAAGVRLPLPFLYKLSLAKLFVDQALPSAGVSGTIVAAQALERSALPRGAVLAGVVINTTSFFTAYIVALCVALGILFRLGRANPVILVPSLLFLLVSGVLAAGTLLLSGRDLTRPGHRFLRFRLVRNALNAMKDADPALVRNAKVQALAAICQLITFLLDAVTLWTLVRSLGADLSLSYAFASFMVANLVRTLSFIPGGLGTFEAAAVLMLRLGGLSVAASLSTVLLFRGVTFFLPMAPGLWFSRKLAPHGGAN